MSCTFLAQYKLKHYLCARTIAKTKKMKKIFIVATIVVVALNLYYLITHDEDRRTPYSEFKTRIEMAPMREYHDPDFGYTVSYPCFFRKEDTSLNDYQGYARFSFTAHANVVLESYVTMNRSHDLASCADSLAHRLHSDRTMLPQENAFLLSGPVYENDVRIEGYSHYEKFIKSGRLLFVYSLTYPDAYKPAMPRLFRLIEGWRVLGAN